MNNLPDITSLRGLWVLLSTSYNHELMMELEDTEMLDDDDFVLMLNPERPLYWRGQIIHQINDSHVLLWQTSLTELPQHIALVALERIQYFFQTESEMNAFYTSSETMIRNQQQRANKIREASASGIRRPKMDS